MNSTFPSKRRGSLIITVSILRTARCGVKKTSLVRSVSMSYAQFTRYMTLLKTCGLITADRTYCQTTEKGKELIKEFESSPLIQSVVT